MRYTFHMFDIFSYTESNLRTLYALGINSVRIKNTVYPKQVRYTTRQTKQRIQEQSTCIFLYNMLYYSSTLMYHEIITKSFTRPIIIILYRL